ncbi:uncharacterized protein B0H18DRAFT_82340 [Fomitopsis serialis]|uniref:uncharacterized protein n=1 Tax=Fomitopsis serialis TaxID=139415 RepID=UPI002007E324|nr:uncharacterized protein B0H18DRAFT_82340 [Neoantrodia serialis]KAH9915828.1 hypothetical protein B0H18DRAFT_82340 [Neoantrodia serialis]
MSACWAYKRASQPAEQDPDNAHGAMLAPVVLTVGDRAVSMGPGRTDFRPIYMYGSRDLASREAGPPPGGHPAPRVSCILRRRRVAGNTARRHRRTSRPLRDSHARGHIRIVTARVWPAGGHDRIVTATLPPKRPEGGPGGSTAPPVSLPARSPLD